MRYCEIIAEAERPQIAFDDKALRRAAALGFDTETIWYHGTKRQFTKFRIPKTRGIDELGKGVYLTSFLGTANVWSLGSGQILACVTRKGKLVELTEMPVEQLWTSGPDHDDRRANPLWREAFHGYNLALNRDYPLPGETAEIGYREFAERVNRGNIRIAECLSEVGYIGATNRYSQIRGQAVIWNPDDVMIVGRTKGVDDYVPD